MHGLPLTPRELTKRAIYRGFSLALAPGKNRRLAQEGAQRVSILCYHRVNDDLRDSVTLGVDHFESQISLIKRDYHVVRPQDIVSGEIDRTSPRPIVAVTFDDGYLDNFTNAVPVLRRHGVPAAFFVSTGIVGTDRQFAHDVDKVEQKLPNMSWDQLREMQADGFEIGAHTVNHINLAQVEEETAIQELTESRDRIRAELSIDDVSFAYCFGKRTDITEPRRDLVRKLGYTACYAAYGGTNEGPIDRFDIKRFGVNYGFSESAFRAKLDGCTLGGPG